MLSEWSLYIYSFHLIIIVTSDVQGVVFTQVGVDTYTIRCSYLSGSTVSGCAYILVSTQSRLEDVTGFIERDSQGVSIMIDNLGCYSEVMAHDNTTGSLPVRASILTNETCHIYTSKELDNYYCALST